MKNVEKVIKDRIHKIESNNLDVLEYNTDSEILTRCKFCLYIKSDNYRNLSYKKFKPKHNLFEKIDNFKEFFNHQQFQ